MSSAVPTPKATSAIVTLLPILSAVFLVFLITGMALPTLPLHIRDGLGFGGLMVGIVAGAQFAAALFSRIWAGDYADGRGAKRAVVWGLAATTVAGLIYLLSLLLPDQPVLSAVILLTGRAVLGGAESFVITGALSWGLAATGPTDAGRVIAWVGTAMYAAFAIGAPLGGWFFDAFGFGAIAAATAFMPLVAFLVVVPIAAVPPLRREHVAVKEVVQAIWLPGIGLAMSSLGFGAMTTFVALLFAERDWQPVWLGVSTFAASFMAARLLFGHAADRYGGARVALVCLLVEAAGLMMVWLAPMKAVAVVGALFTGFGYSLVYPGFGVEVVRRTPPRNRGLAMGTFTAFLDLALGVSSPLLGLLASHTGTVNVFLMSAVVVLGAAFVAIWLREHPTRG